MMMWVFIFIIRKQQHNKGLSTMTNQEYKQMYIESCVESGAKCTSSGLRQFIVWRKHVESFFDEMKSKT